MVGRIILVVAYMVISIVAAPVLIDGVPGPAVVARQPLVDSQLDIKRIVSPEADKRGITPQGDKRGITPQGDKRGITPQGDKRGITPQGDKRGVTPEGE